MKKRLKIYHYIILLLLLWLSYTFWNITDEFQIWPLLTLFTFIHLCGKYRFFPMFISKRLQPFSDWTEKHYRLFHIRQIRGRKPIKANNAECVCLNCGNTFTGNYCNHCGQTRHVKRLTWKTLMTQVFLALTRLANGYPRTIVELIYRPGYMISAFLRGHRAPYLAPFNALFFTVAIYIITIEVVAPEILKKTEDNTVEKTEIANEKTGDWVIDKITTVEEMFNSIEKRLESILDNNEFSWNTYNIINKWADNNKTLSILFTIPIFSIATILATSRRRQKAMYNPTEQFFIQGYIATQLIIFSLIKTLITGKANDDVHDLPIWLIFIIFCFDYTQLFGYSAYKAYWRTSLMFFYSLIIFLLIVLIFVGAVIGIYELLN